MLQIKKKKTLIVSLGYEGGCLYYANSIIRNLSKSFSYNLIVSSSSEDIPKEATLKLPLYKGMLGQLLFLSISPLVFLYILFCAYFKYDKLVVFGPNNFDSLFLCVFKILKKDSYLVIHDGIMHAGEKDRYHQKLLNLSMKYASNHIFLTNYVALNVQTILHIVRPYFILPHGPIIYGEPKEAHLGNELRLLVIGRLSPYKGLHIIKDIVPKLSSYNCKLTIAGSMSSESRSLFESDENVNIVNHYLTEQEINDYINNNDVILMPYTEATQSGIAAISIGYCKPAIITKVGGLPEQLSCDEAFYMENVNAESLEEQIKLLKSDNTIYYHKTNKLSQKRQQLSWKKIAEEFELNLANH